MRESDALWRQCRNANERQAQVNGQLDTQLVLSVSNQLEIRYPSPSAIIVHPNQIYDGRARGNISGSK